MSTKNNSIANSYAKGSMPRILNVSNKNIMKSPNIKILGGMRLIAQGWAHQDLLHAPTMWVTMSVVANNLKSMVQTTNNLHGVHDMKSPFTRTSMTTPRGGPPQELQDCQVMRCPTMMQRFLQWCLPYHMPPPQRLLQDGRIATRSIPRLMIVTIKDIMNILKKLTNNRDKRHIKLKANHNMVPHLW
jgi:hypothetical protein